jgi:hypothetical protein
VKREKKRNEQELVQTKSELKDEISRTQASIDQHTSLHVVSFIKRPFFVVRVRRFSLFATQPPALKFFIFMENREKR